MLYNKFSLLKTWQIMEHRLHVSHFTALLRYLFGIKSDLVGSGRRGFYPLMSDESC